MTELDALQTTLGGRARGRLRLRPARLTHVQAAEPELYVALRAAYEAHRDRRDTLIGEIAALGATPAPAAAAYTPPAGLDTIDGRYQAALALERGCASTYAALVGATAGPRRLEAIALLNDAAARELSFRGTPEIFPGADEYADR